MFHMPFSPGSKTGQEECSGGFTLPSCYQETYLPHWAG